MLDRIERIEQDLRNWGQRQMAVLSHDDMTALRVICDGLSCVRADMRRESPAAGRG